MTEDEAKRRFAPYFTWFQECWRAGWDEYKHHFSHPWDDRRSISVIIQNRAIIHARGTLEKFGDINYIEHNTRRLFKFEEWAIVQFKKLTDWEGRLCLSNNMNATADAFDKQEPMLEIGDAPRITVGYLPNEFHTDMSVYMIHTKSHYENNWAIPISDLPVETTIELFKANDEQVSEQTRRVRAKAQASTHPPDEQFAQGKND